MGGIKINNAILGAFVASRLFHTAGIVCPDTPWSSPSQPGAARHNRSQPPPGLRRGNAAPKIVLSKIGQPSQMELFDKHAQVRQQLVRNLVDGVTPVVQNILANLVQGILIHRNSPNRSLSRRVA